MAKIRVLAVHGVQAALQKSNPPQLAITAMGVTTTAGWTAPELKSLEKKLSADGILDLEFIAEPPSGLVPLVLTPIMASLVVTDDAERIVGLRVVARTNDIVQLLSGQGPAEFTTLALGEEGPQPTTRALGEEGPLPTTLALGEEGPSPTTFFVGEEGPQPTTLALGEEGPSPTTFFVGEEGPQPTTLAFGEEGPVPTTFAFGEEGGGIGSGGIDPGNLAGGGATTMATGEEGPPPTTTAATGEEQGKPPIGEGKGPVGEMTDPFSMFGFRNPFGQR